MSAFGRKRTLIFVDFAGSNVRFGEKRTLSVKLPRLNRKTSALPSEADIALTLGKGSANDPKRTYETMDNSEC